MSGRGPAYGEGSEPADVVGRAREGRISVLCNPEGGRVAKALETVRRAGRALAGDAYREAVREPEIAAAVAEALDEAADVLCLVGGDGTVQAALTALDRASGDDGAAGWPLLAPVAGGTANVTARDLDAGEAPAARLEALLRWRRGERPARRIRRAVLRVSHPDLDGGAVCGLFFGTGLVATGVRIFRRRLSGLEVTGQAPGAVVLARILWGLATGGLERDVEPRSVEVSVDGGELRVRPCLLCVAGTLERFLWRTRPYWGPGEGPIRFTLVERGARRLWLRLLRLARGRPGSALTPEDGYHSRSARRVELRFDGPLVVDGELHRVRATGGPVRVGVAAEPDWLTF